MLAASTSTVREPGDPAPRRGLETLASQGQAQSALESARQALGYSNEHVDLTRLRLATLLGAGPGRAEDVTRPTDPVLAVLGLPSNIPADLIGRRPDVRAARYRVEARAAQIRQACAGFYPSINISAFIGPQVLGLGQFFNAASLAAMSARRSARRFFVGVRFRRISPARTPTMTRPSRATTMLIHALQDVAKVTTSTRAMTNQLAHAQAARDAANVAYQADRALS